MFGNGDSCRGTYCALSVASLLNLLTPELTSGCAQFIQSCQSFQGGLAGYPGVEAHGGYTYCAVAALTLLDAMDQVDLDQLLFWFVSRQMSFEGGFCGRTNKLVDGCYSFWQGGLGVLLELEASKKHGPIELFHRGFTFNVAALQNYTLACCQEEKGGLRDKPEKNPDYYHTCYCLSGLSLAQYLFSWVDNKLHVEPTRLLFDLQVTHPVHNIGLEAVHSMRHYFSR